MTITRTVFELINRDGDPIRGDVFAARNSKPDSATERTGYPAIIFNFSGNGIGPDLLNFTELDKFEGNTFSKEIDDLEAILDSSEAGNLPGIGERYSFGLMGHSRGGISVIVTAAEDPRVDSVVTWNAVSKLDRWSDEHKEEWRSKGRVTVLNARTGQELPLGLGLLEDYERNAERLDLLQAASDLQQPHLIIHGASDESVRVSEGERLYAASGKDTTRFELIDGAGHTFGAVHPFAGTTEHLTSVIGLTADWFTETLNG
jgi:pimeloyl-ACP methyl ester carboxylesterase